MESVKYGYAPTATALQLAALKRVRFDHVYEEKRIDRRGRRMLIWTLARE
jgi:hypothetical protein